MLRLKHINPYNNKLFYLWNRSLHSNAPLFNSSAQQLVKENSLSSAASEPTSPSSPISPHNSSFLSPHKLQQTVNKYISSATPIDLNGSYHHLTASLRSSIYVSLARNKSSVENFTIDNSTIDEQIMKTLNQLREQYSQQSDGNKSIQVKEVVELTTQQILQDIHRLSQTQQILKQLFILTNQSSKAIDTATENNKSLPSSPRIHTLPMYSSQYHDKLKVALEHRMDNPLLTVVSSSQKNKATQRTPAEPVESIAKEAPDEGISNTDKAQLEAAWALLDTVPTEILNSRLRNASAEEYKLFSEQLSLETFVLREAVQRYEDLRTDLLKFKKGAELKPAQKMVLSW
jgi:hypothetical protein